MTEWIVSGWLHIIVAGVIVYIYMKKKDWALAQIKAAFAWVKGVKI